MDVTDLGTGPWSTEQLYMTHKPFLFSIAYRMLGSVSDAEDVVQELFLTIHDTHPENINHLKAYLGKMVTNRCLNLLKSARKRKETYFGPWLPEPLAKAADNPPEAVERGDAISYAYLVMLDRLSPVERAIFVLREAFDYEYREIADMVEKSEAACRKILSRAKKKLGPYPSRPLPDRPDRDEKLVQQFVTAFAKGNVEEIIDLLAEDVSLISDGGGKVRAAVNPIVSRPRVLALLKTMASRRFRDARLSVTAINGESGMVVSSEGVVKGVVCFEWTEDMKRIRRIFTVVNPDKLKHISVR